MSGRSRIVADSAATSVGPHTPHSHASDEFRPRLDERIHLSHPLACPRPSPTPRAQGEGAALTSSGSRPQWRLRRRIASGRGHALDAGQVLRGSYPARHQSEHRHRRQREPAASCGSVSGGASCPRDGNADWLAVQYAARDDRAAQRDRAEHRGHEDRRPPGTQSAQGRLGRPAACRDVRRLLQQPPAADEAAASLRPNSFPIARLAMTANRAIRKLPPAA